jgi:Peptidase dimerisation domain
MFGTRFRSSAASHLLSPREERACEGVFPLGRHGALGPAGLLIVAEPSSNLPIIAHKGCASPRRGRPHTRQCRNCAKRDLTSWIRLIETLKFPTQRHPLLGSTTSSVTTVYGGQNINSVPASASFTVDYRTISTRDPRPPRGRRSEHMRRRSHYRNHHRFPGGDRPKRSEGRSFDGYHRSAAGKAGPKRLVLRILRTLPHWCPASTTSRPW